MEDVPDDKRICIGQDPDYCEADPRGLVAGIQIRNLQKVRYYPVVELTFKNHIKN